MKFKPQTLVKKFLLILINLFDLISIYNLVSVTLNIEKDEKQGDIDESENETGSAALTCTNFALGLFLGAFTVF